jgi:hypothetical protein
LILESLDGRSLMCSVDLLFALQAFLLEQGGGQPGLVTEPPAADPTLSTVPAAASQEPPATVPDQAVATSGSPLSVASPPTDSIAPAVAEPLSPQVLADQGSPPVSRDRMRVSGRVFNDVDRDGVREAGEAGLRGVRVYLDLNNDGRRNTNEPSRRTDAAGRYAFGGLEVGTYSVREELRGAWQPSLPTSGVLIVTPDLGPKVTGANFGNYKATPAAASGPGVSTEAVQASVLTPPSGAAASPYAPPPSAD